MIAAVVFGLYIGVIVYAWRRVKPDRKHGLACGLIGFLMLSIAFVLPEGRFTIPFLYGATAIIALPIVVDIFRSA